MADTQVLAGVAAIIIAAAGAMLFFRIPRELDMRRRGEPTWIPVADWLLLGATFTAIFLVLLPILLFDSQLAGTRVPTAACAAALVALVGYVPALLAHYRLILSPADEGRQRTNPEPAEGGIVIGTTAVALAVFGISLITVTE